MATREQIASQITSLQRHVAAIEAKLDQVIAALDLAPPAVTHRSDPTRGVFIPGTGWTNSPAPEPANVDVSDRGAPVVQLPQEHP